MNDRFKFRGWDKYNKIMHYDFQFIKSGEEGNDWICFISDKQPMKCDKTKIIFDSPYFRQQIEIMQSTGLKDKNGKPIYEGDILLEVNGKYHVVKWNNNQATFFIDRIEKTGWFDTWHLARHNLDYEVIGNVYENKELLDERN